MSGFSSNAARSRLRILRLDPAPSGGYFLAFAANDHDTFNAAKDLVRMLPEHWREWRPDERAWWVAAQGIHHLAGLMPALRERLEGPVRSEADPSASPMRRPELPPDVARALQRLHLLPSAPAELVKAAFRIAAKGAHPDHGGKHTEMVALSKAHEKALEWARRSTTSDQPARAG